ncbi:MAG: hypothetical protein PHF24_07290 [Syntrophomonas sp.]|nr:hypothetical protein [Syntrophomonas sp.]
MTALLRYIINLIAVNLAHLKNEADVFNVALFGITAKQWREEHPDKNGNIRDYVTLNQLLDLANMEAIMRY